MKITLFYKIGTKQLIAYRLGKYESNDTKAWSRVVDVDNDIFKLIEILERGTKQTIAELMIEGLGADGSPGLMAQWEG